MAEILNYAADININEAETRKALGLSVGDIHEPNYKGHFAILVLHSDKDGIYDGISIDEDFWKNHIIEEEVRVNRGDKVMSFSAANAALGTLFLKFETREDLTKALANPNEWLKIKLKQH